VLIDIIVQSLFIKTIFYLFNECTPIDWYCPHAHDPQHCIQSFSYIWCG